MHRILLVEDEPFVRELYGLELQDAGFEVRAASTCAEALLVASSWQPDCCVVDIRLGAENGLDLVRHLLEVIPASRTVLLTGYPGYKDDFASWVADAFVLKHAETSELVRQVQELVSASVAS